MDIEKNNLNFTSSGEETVKFIMRNKKTIHSKNKLGSSTSKSNKFKVKLLFKPKHNGEVPLGISTLDAFLSKQGYCIEQFVFNTVNNPFFDRSSFTNSLRDRILNWLGMQYLNSNRNNSFTQKLDKIINEMDLQEVNLLGFSLISKEQLLIYLTLAKRIKQKHKIPIVFGGPFVKLFHDLIDLKKYNFIDFLVTSDGELALFELIRYLEGKQTDMTKVPSIKYILNNKVIINEEKLLDFREMPAPNYETHMKSRIENPGSLIYSEIPYQISKGCPFKCSFCTYPSLNMYQRKPLDKVIKDLKFIKKTYNYNRISFTDATINSNPSYLGELCDAIIKEELNITWGAAATPNINIDLLKKMKRAGCEMLAYGIETGSQHINTLMRKSVSVEKGEKCLHDTYLAGIETLVFIIIGFPQETKSDFEETMKFIMRNKKTIHSIFLQRFRLSQKTTIFDKPELFNIKILENYPNLNFDAYQFDEINGLKWKQKDKQTKMRINIIRNILKKHNINHVYSSRVLYES